MPESVDEHHQPNRGRLSGAHEVQNLLHPSDDAIASTTDDHEAATSTTAYTESRTASLRSTSADSRHPPSRTLSLNDHRRNKRITITLPIPTGSANAQGPASPTRWMPTSPVPEDLTSPTGPTDSSFLTALAAQERRVLELKEELGRAELQLRKLKRDWAAHEAQKKRHDAKRVQKMRPMSLAMPSPNSKEEQTAMRAHELERKKALMVGTKQSGRTVFSGSRHARTLSLLTTSGTDQSAPQTQPEHTPSQAQRPPLTHRPSTNPDLTKEVVLHADETIDLGLPRDVLIRTGRQMASDFKDGLWTFIEDLRQVTVGEEGVNGPQQQRHTQLGRSNTTGPRAERAMNRASTRTVRNPREAKKQTPAPPTKQPPAEEPPTTPTEPAKEDSLVDAAGSFWKENGLDEPAQAVSPVKRKPVKKFSSPKQSTTHANATTDDWEDKAWDAWDSPVTDRTKDVSDSISEAQGVDSARPARRSSEKASSTRNFAELLSPTTLENQSNREGIPWPALIKLAPSNLRRTASHLMEEWEKSLTSSPDEMGGKADYVAAAGGTNRKAD
ncbi:hypothetical protein MBLNU457_g1097t1 [Dothideomycetes sp. NU457]